MSEGGRGKLGEVEFLPKSTCNYGAQISIVVLIHSSVSALLPTGENNKLFQKWSIPPLVSSSQRQARAREINLLFLRHTCWFYSQKPLHTLPYPRTGKEVSNLSDSCLFCYGIRACLFCYGIRVGIIKEEQWGNAVEHKKTTARYLIFLNRHPLAEDNWLSVSIGMKTTQLAYYLMAFTRPMYVFIYLFIRTK